MPLPETPRKLPVVYSDEPIKGTKYASLHRDRQGEAYFLGTAGFQYPYYTEGYAACAMGKHTKEQVPDPDCTCGFWIPVRRQSALAQWTADNVQLEVEAAGHVWEFGKRTAWGYRAQWQRVLSVTLPADCGMKLYHGGPCVGDPSTLVARADSHVLTACSRHSMLPDVMVIDRPLSWLRRSLRTEVRPGTVQDDSAAGDLEWRDAVRKVSGELCSVSAFTEAMPLDPADGDRFRVCANARTQLIYELVYSGCRWVVEHIYHPRLAPWGWGEPDTPGT